MRSSPGCRISSTTLPPGTWIIAMPATARKGTVSRIVPIITEGSAVTTPRNDVNYVVTEYGIAQLKGKTLKERAKALIMIAHPKFRPHLIIEYRKRFNEEPFTKEEAKEFTSIVVETIKTKNEERIEKIKDVLEEISTMGNLQKEAESRIRKLQDKYFELNNECTDLTNQIKSIIKTLEGLNIDDYTMKEFLKFALNENIL